MQTPTVEVFGQDDDGYGTANCGSNKLALASRGDGSAAFDETTESSKKRRTRRRDARGRLLDAPGKKKLSKAKRRRLEHVVETRKKWENRDAVLKSLAEYQLDLKEMEQFPSVAKMQDKQNPKRVNDPKKCKMNSLAGAKKNAPATSIDDRGLSRKQVWHTGVHYDTDSGSSDDDTEEVEERTPSDSNAPCPSSESDVAADIPVANEADVAENVKQEPIERTLQSDSDVEVLPTPSKPKSKKKRNTLTTPLTSIDTKTEATATSGESAKVTNVPVYRSSDIQELRLKLPIFAEEQSIVEAIKENPVVIICGETGSGKTTQVPQFLYEAGFTQNSRLIGITEPRRVAAVSMSQRVGLEMGLSSDVVSYQIRHEGNATERTQIKFMTDGVLLKELQNDVRLSKYSAIIIDEAHERSMYSDVLLGLLSRIVPLRAVSNDPLKLIVMSATLRVRDFTQPHLFRVEPKVVKVESRQYPVTIHFNRRTPDNYMKEAFDKVSKIHRRLPDGGILVFVSGQQEVRLLIRLLRERFPMPNGQSSTCSKRHGKQKNKKRDFTVTPAFNLSSYTVDSATKPDCDFDETGAAEQADILDDDDESNFSDFVTEQSLGDDEALYCLPLYSLLPTHRQAEVFLTPPAGVRLCVVATNVAETSLTIPHVKYVVDTGKEKTRVHDPITSVSQFAVRWTSQASANQRAGRAGRTAAGHCWRLYSSAVFTDSFHQFSTPEILNKPVDELVLQMKSMNIVKVCNFPFPTPPDRDSLAIAEQRLLKLGALDDSKKDGVLRITELGKTLALFPVAPKFGKVLALSDQHGLLPYAVCLVAALSVREPLINLASVDGSSTDEGKMKILHLLRIRRAWAEHGEAKLLGDLTVLLKAVGAAEYDGMTADFCAKHGLRMKAMIDIRKLRKQLTNVLNTNCRLAQPLTMDQRMEPPSDSHARFLRQIMLAGLADSVAMKTDTSGDGVAIKGSYQTQGLKEPVFIHPSSVLYKEQPRFVVYQELIEAGGKKCMTTVCAVEPQWLTEFAAGYCSFGEAPSDAKPQYDSTNDVVTVERPCTFGPHLWSLGRVQRPHVVDIAYYRCIATALLQGRLFPKLVEFVGALLARPDTMTKSWAHLQPRVERLLDRLVEKDACSRQAILNEFQLNKSYLLNEYCQWLPESLHSDVHVIWPPV